MARKAEAESTTKTPGRKVDEKLERGSPSRSPSETSTVTGKSRHNRPLEAAAGQETRAPKTAARPSALLDTRVVYCGDKNDGLRDVFNQALTGSNWVDQDHYNHMKIYGYQDMTFLQYNHAGDWPQ